MRHHRNTGKSLEVASEFFPQAEYSERRGTSIGLLKLKSSMSQ